MQIGDRVEYVGNQYDLYRSLALTVWNMSEGYAACTYSDPGRPSNRALGIPRDTGVTTWIKIDDLAIVQN